MYNLLTWQHPDDPEIKKRARTLSSFMRYTFGVAIVIVGGMMILDQIGVDIRPVLAGAGVLGLAIGFGAQNLVQDLISGIFILLEDQIRVGDVVNLKGKGGLVEKIGIRTVQLRDFDGSAHFVRNGQIDIISNMTKEFSNYVFDIRVGYEHEIEPIAKILRGIDEEMRAEEPYKSAILTPIEIFGVERLEDSATIFRARTRTKPLRQWEVGREFNKRIRARFKQAGIQIPGPQMRVYMPNIPGGINVAPAESPTG